uniref:Protein kinase domain-containing protein n=1 Tax=Elaeophora elaphi TaxID=1147741 RepID=A0A0R3RYZ9_9BILA
LQNHEFDALLLFGQGLPKSTLFSAGINTPSHFDQKKFDDSLMVTSINKTINCANYMLDRTVSSMIDTLNMMKTFQLGVSLGCDLNRPELTLATVAAVLQIVISAFIGVKDFITEYSAPPSINLANYFSPTKTVVATSASLQRIEEKNCALMIDIGSMKAIVFGNGRMPHTLVMAVEKKTSSLVYEFAADLCAESLQNQSIRELLNTSTLILIPSIPYKQLYCYDYTSLMQFRPFVEKVLNIYPLIDYVILLGTGGMKVRYTDASGLGRVKDLALNYVSLHSLIGTIGSEMCNRNDLTPQSTVSEFHERMEKWQKAPDILLVQAACCYEQRQRLYAENKASLISTLSKRVQGLSGTIKGMYGKPVKAPVKLTVGGSVFYTKYDGYYYIWLSPGIYTVSVYKESYQPYTFSTEIALSKQTIHDILLTESSSSFSSLFNRKNFFVLFTAFCILVLVFIGLYRLIILHKAKSTKRWRDGFERLPLNDFDSNVSDDDDIVLGSTKSFLQRPY